MADRQLREDVLNTMAAVAYQAIKAGEDWTEVPGIVEQKFPGTPSAVIADAVFRAERQRDEEWWAQVEATIDCEAVRKAVVAVSVGNGGGK